MVWINCSVISWETPMALELPSLLLDSSHCPKDHYHNDDQKM